MSGKINLLTFTCLLSGFALLPAAAWAQRGDCNGAQPEGWQIVIADADEPGERLVVSGKVLDVDGKPVAGATILVYHTDVHGYYSRGGRDESNARLCGVMLSDEGGNYRYETIRPASYPSGRVPQHVHYVVWDSDDPRQRRQRMDLQFADDALAAGRYRDGSPSWSTIRPLEKAADGTWQVTKDLKLK